MGEGSGFDLQFWRDVVHPSGETWYQAWKVWLLEHKADESQGIHTQEAGREQEVEQRCYNTSNSPSVTGFLQ